ncbi:MAG: PEP-CTERM sorting domain-containing protein [Chthonomonas sp.]|nr:PEP-CTERM sorting domain-containing protein [Chthonomonas sp.]
MRIAKIYCLALVAGLAPSAFANITGFTAAVNSGVVHKNASSNPLNVYYASASGIPHSFSDPLTISSPGTMNYSSQVSTAGQMTINTPTVWEYRSTFAGDVGCYGSPNMGISTGYAEIGFSSWFTVTLDAPGTLYAYSTNTVANLTFGSLQSTAALRKSIQVNGVFIHGTFSDGAYVVPLAAGVHSVQIDEQALASFVASPLNPTDSAFAYGTSRTRVRIESVPEPGTMAVGLGLAALLLRRRR